MNERPNNMDMPNYKGVIEQWKIDLINKRAKLLRFKAHEIPDVLQEAALAVLNFKYDPNHAKGATERSALTSVIDNQLRKLQRHVNRYNMHLNEVVYNTGEHGHDEINMLSMDVRDVISGLPEREQIVCQELSEGSSIAQIAEQLGCSWHTIERIIRNLRERFTEAGLGDEDYYEQ